MADTNDCEEDPPCYKCNKVIKSEEDELNCYGFCKHWFHPVSVNIDNHKYWLINKITK